MLATDGSWYRPDTGVPASYDTCSHPPHPRRCPAPAWAYFSNSFLAVFISPSSSPPKSLASFCTSSAPCASFPPTSLSPSARDVRTWFLAASIVVPRLLRISALCSAVGLSHQSLLPSIVLVQSASARAMGITREKAADEEAYRVIGIFRDVSLMR